MYKLFDVAAYNMENGDILFERQTISAKSEVEARDRVIRTLSDVEYPVAEVVVRPFG